MMPERNWSVLLGIHFKEPFTIDEADVLIDRLESWNPAIERWTAEITIGVTVSAAVAVFALHYVVGRLSAIWGEEREWDIVSIQIEEDLEDA